MVKEGAVVIDVGQTRVPDQTKKNGFRNVGDVDFENVKNKLEIEALWNQLILIKFSSKVKINDQVNSTKQLSKENIYVQHPKTNVS